MRGATHGPGDCALKGENVSTTPPDRAFIVKSLVGFALLMLVLPVLLFVSAGTIRWPMAWVYCVVTIVLVMVSRIIMARASPELVSERAGRHADDGVQEWDKKLVPIVGFFGPMLMLIVSGLDKRWTWSPALPLAVQIATLLVVAGAALFATWAMIVNRYFSATVRIQRDRGHTVVDTGPYRIVRHPGYAGGIVAGIAGPLALGSLWALLPAVLHVAIIIYRTAREDTVLHEQLDGYAAYAKRVRYRLLPGVW